MKSVMTVLIPVMALLLSNARAVGDEARQFVELPVKMQQHMLANMRDHLAAINEILHYLGADDPDRAADIAEMRLGMSSLESHGAAHMAAFMPPGMREAGNDMHRAASRFALKAQEGNTVAAYAALAEVTTACVACHAAYRIHQAGPVVEIGIDDLSGEDIAAFLREHMDDMVSVSPPESRPPALTTGPASRAPGR